MVIEKLQLGDKINYTDYPELFGDELTFEQLCTEPSSSLLIAWRDDGCRAWGDTYRAIDRACNALDDIYWIA